MQGYLIQWTKGFTARGVEGQDIANMLQEALARQVNIFFMKNKCIHFF